MSALLHTCFQKEKKKIRPEKNGIGASIPIGWKIQCLPYAGFFLVDQQIAHKLYTDDVAECTAFLTSALWDLQLALFCAKTVFANNWPIVGVFATFHGL